MKFQFLRWRHKNVVPAKERVLQLKTKHLLDRVRMLEQQREMKDIEYRIIQIENKLLIPSYSPYNDDLIGYNNLNDPSKTGKNMKCKKCGAEGILVNDQPAKGYRIFQCPNWDRGICDYGCFGEIYVDGKWKEITDTDE